MVERPVLFNGEMVRAILAGRKTQTRRVVKPQPDLSVLKNPTASLEWRRCPILGPTHCPSEWGLYGVGTAPGSVPIYGYDCPYGVPGDGLWVRETWGAVWPDIDREYALEECDIEYRANLPLGCTDYPGEWPADEAKGNPDAPTWKPSIHMPRWASRLTLEVTSVRVERVQEISKRDAIAEGIRWNEAFPEGYVRPDSYHGFGSAEQAFLSLWDSINAKRGFSWPSNPWVWVVEFEVRG